MAEEKLIVCVDQGGGKAPDSVVSASSLARHSPVGSVTAAAALDISDPEASRRVRRGRGEGENQNSPKSSEAAAISPEGRGVAPDSPAERVAGGLRCELRSIATAAHFEEAKGEWVRFLTQPGVLAGFFTDPVVLEQQIDFVRGDKFLLGKVLENGELAAIVPLMCRRTRVALQFGLLSLGRFPADVAKLPDFEFPRHRTVDPFAALACAVDACRGREWSPDLILVDLVSGAGDGRESHGLRVRCVQTTYSIRLEGDFDSYVRSLSSNSRMKIRRKERRLEEASGGQMRVVCYRALDEMESLRGLLSEVWEKSWHGRVGRHHVPSLDYLSIVAKHGWIRAYVLFAGERPVASILGFQYRDTYYYEAPAYVQEWREHSPGIVLLFSALRDMFAKDRPARVDFGAGYGEFKEVFGTHEERCGTIRVGISSYGKLVVGLQSGMDTLFVSARDILARTGLPRLLKRRIREGK